MGFPQCFLQDDKYYDIYHQLLMNLALVPFTPSLTQALSGSWVFATTVVAPACLASDPAHREAMRPDLS